MTESTKRLLSLAACAVAPLLPLIVPATATALSISGVEVDPKSLPAPEQNLSLSTHGRVDRYLLARTVGENFSLRQHTGQGTEAFARLLPYQQKASRLIGLIEKTGRDRLSLPAVDEKLRCFIPFDARLLPITDMQLTEISKLYMDIAKEENLQFDKAKEYSTADLKGGIPLGSTGWAFRSNGQYNYVLLNTRTGQGVNITGDPHLHDASGLTWYGDWTAPKVVIELPSEDPNNRLLIFATASGGSAANGFGVPQELIAITDHIAICIKGLDTDPAEAKATGLRTADPYFVYRTRLDEIRAAPQYFWDDKTAELRLASGDRPAPPPTAQQYQRSVPALADNVDQTSLLRGVFRLAAEDQNGIDRLDRQFYEVARQARAATEHPTEDGVGEAIKKNGRAFLDDAKPYAAHVIDYVDARAKLVANLEKLRNELDVLLKGIGEDADALAGLDQLGDQLEAKQKAVEVAIEEISRVDAKTRQQRQQHAN